MGVGGPQGGGSSVAAPVEVAQRLAERALACWWRTAASAGERGWRRAHRGGGDAGDREEPAAGGGAGSGAAREGAP